MTMLCTQCHGTKKYSPLGFMQIACTQCNETGYQPINLMPLLYPLTLDNTQLQPPTEQIKKKKRYKKARRLKRYNSHNVVNELRDRISKQ